VLVLAILSGAIVLWWLVLAACLPLGLQLVPRIPTDARPATFPARVSVIVRARRDEEPPPRCLASLATQDMAPLEVFVDDDDSTDLTRNAAGDWLLFLDGDIELAPAALRATVAAAETQGAAALTAASRFDCATVWEAIIQPPLAMLIMMQGPRGVSDPNDRQVSASCGFLLFRREAYEANEAVGGHASVRCVVNATHLLRFRRFQSAGELWHQWCLAFGGALAGRRWPALGSAVCTALTFTGAHAAAMSAFFVTPVPLAWVLWGLAITQTCASLAVGRLLGLEPRYVVLQPIGALFAVGVLLHAAVAPTRTGASSLMHAAHAKRAR